jgi:molybdopterin converting factor small subunit
MPTVVIPPPYRGPTQGRDRIEVRGATVGECLDAVEALHPGFRAMVVDEGGSVHRFVKLFRNREPLVGDPLAAALAPGDELEVMSAIAGG